MDGGGFHTTAAGHELRVGRRRRRIGAQGQPDLRAGRGDGRRRRATPRVALSDHCQPGAVRRGVAGLGGKHGGQVHRAARGIGADGEALARAGDGDAPGGKQPVRRCLHGARVVAQPAPHHAPGTARAQLPQPPGRRAGHADLGIERSVGDDVHVHGSRLSSGRRRVGVSLGAHDIPAVTQRREAGGFPGWGRAQPAHPVAPRLPVAAARATWALGTEYGPEGRGGVPHHLDLHEAPFASVRRSATAWRWPSTRSGPL